MAVAERDAFDLALAAIALALALVPAVGASNPAAVVGRAVSAVVSVGPIAYLVVLGVTGVLFMAYAVLYLPTTQ